MHHQELKTWKCALSCHLRDLSIGRFYSKQSDSQNIWMKIRTDIAGEKILMFGHTSGENY